MRKHPSIFPCFQLFLATLLLLAAAARAQVNSIPLSSLPQNTRLAIWGDSITEMTYYPVYVEGYLLACAGRQDIKVFTSGRSGEPLEGMASRITDLEAFNPTAISFSYGMNDTLYTPYTASKGASYTTAMQTALSALVNLGISQRIVAGPSAVDVNFAVNGLSWQNENVNLSEFSGIGYTGAVNTSSADADVYDRMSQTYAAAQAVLGPDYGFTNDGVHPAVQGDLMMAYEILKTLTCSGSIGSINVNMTGGATASAGQTVVSASNGVVVLSSSQYPFCYDYDPNTYQYVENAQIVSQGITYGLSTILPYLPFSQDLNRYMLTVTNLSGTSANVTWGGKTMTFTSAQLAAGVNLPDQFRQTPFDATFAQVMAEIFVKHEFEDYMTKYTADYVGNDNGGNIDNNMIAAQAQLDAAVKALIAPVRHTIIIVPNGSSGPAAPVITGTMMAYPTVGQPFSYQITTFTPATSFSATGLPNGLSLNAGTGLITGTPTATGVSVVTLTATNASGASSTTLTLTAQNIPPVPVITSPLTVTGTVGIPFSYQITATNNPTGYFVSVEGNNGTIPPATSLPPGLTYNTSTGLFYGTPTATGTYAISSNTAVSIAAMNAGGVGFVQMTSLIITGSGGSGGAPSAPGSLTATAGNAQATLNWTVSGGATSYNVYGGTTASGENATPIATGVTATTYTNTGLTNGTTYYYKVAAVNASGTSGYSTEASATPSTGVPAAPTGLTGTPGNAQVSLAWTAASGATTYSVYRGTSPGGEGATPLVSGLPLTIYLDEGAGVNNGTTYYYKVLAVNSTGASGYSNEISATPTAGGSAGITWGSAANMTGTTDVSTSGAYVDAASFYTSALTVNGVTFKALAESGTSYSDGANITIGANNGTSSTPSFTSASPSSASYGDLAQTVGFGYYVDGTVTLSGLTTGHTYQVQVWSCYSGTPGGDSTTLTGDNSVTLVPENCQFAIGTFTATGASQTFNYNYNTYYDMINAVSLRDTSSGGGAPAAPAGLTAAPGNAQAALSWVSSSGATTYNVYSGTTAGGENAAPIATGVTGTTFMITGLANGTTYYYKVAAVNASGTSGYSNEASATPEAGGSAPAAPTNLAVTPGNAQVALSWVSSSGATTYNVYSGTTAGGENAIPIATGVTATTFTNTGLANGTTYYYKVVAVNASGTSGYSNEASATPTAGGSAGITWGSAVNMTGTTDVSTSGAYVDAASFYTSALTVNGVTFKALAESGTSYSDGANITIGANNGTSSTPSFTSASPSSASYGDLAQTVGFGYYVDGTVTLSGLTTGHTYQVQVWSCYSGTPGGDSTTLTGDNSVTLVPENCQFAIGTFTATGASQTFNYNYNTYYDMINAVSLRDTSSGGGAPAAPAGLTAAPGNAQAALSWVSSSGATTYNVYSGTTAGGENAAPIATGVTGTTFMITGLANGTTYYYKVAAVNASGTSGYSNEASATPEAGGSAPAAPTNLAVTPGNAQVALSWVSSSGATTYNVYSGTTAGGENAIPIATGVTATTFTNTGLANGTTYYYKVVAVNASGTSGYSNEASATPTAGGSAGITWGSAVNMTGTTDVSTSGAYVDAASFYTSALTVNGVTFNPLLASGTVGGLQGYTDGKISANSPGNSPGAYGAAFTTASPSSAAYSQATSTIAFGYYVDGTVTLSGLTTGDTYQVQVWSWYNDSSGNCHTTLTGANTVTLAPETGQYAVGTFTAGSGSLSFNYNYGNDYGIINAVSVRNITSGGGSAPAAPTGLSATAGNTQVSLGWTASTGAISYNIYCGTSAGGESATPIATGVTTTSYSNTGLTNGTAYYYKVCAVNASGISGYSNEASATPTAGGGQGITWGSAANMTGTTDVSTYGAYVDAASFYTSALTVNSVTFKTLTESGTTYSDGANITIGANNGTSGGNSFTTTAPSSASYSDLVQTVGFGYYVDGTVTLSGLTTGHTYQVQVWSCYSGTPGGDSTTLTGANTVTLVPEKCQFAIGTFTATGASQNFYYDYNTYYDMINAVSLRDTTTP